MCARPAIREPGVATFALLAIAAGVIVALVWLLRRMLRARKAADPPPPNPAHGS